MISDTALPAAVSEASGSPMLPETEITYSQSTKREAVPYGDRLDSVK